MKTLIFCAAVAALGASTGCGPQIVHFAPYDVTGNAEIREGRALVVRPAEGVRIDVSPCQAIVVRDDKDRQFTLLVVEIAVTNQGKDPVLVDAKEAALKENFVTTRLPARTPDRARGEALDPLPVGSADAWQIHFDMGGPEAIENISHFTFSLPIAIGDKIASAVADFRPFDPNHRRYYYAYGPRYSYYDPFWYGVGFGWIWSSHAHWHHRPGWHTGVWW